MDRTQSFVKGKFLALMATGIAIAFMAGCESANQVPVTMPAASIDCSEGSCGSGLNGRTVIVVVTRSGCGSSANYDFVATGSTSVSCSSSRCSGTVSSWRDANNSVVTEILTGRHDVCAYIDTNGDLQQQAGEMEHQSSVTISDNAPLVLDSWDATP